MLNGLNGHYITLGEEHFVLSLENTETLLNSYLFLRELPYANLCI